MSNVLPLYVVDIFEDIVNRTKTEVLATIQANESAVYNNRTSIETINYQKGPMVQLQQTLVEMGKVSTTQSQKYPLVYLVQDFPEVRGREVGIYADVSLRIIIAHYTRPDRKVDDRMSKVFKPVLYPIYYELLNQIALEPRIVEASEEDLHHVKTDRLFVGTQPPFDSQGKDQNILSDYLDAIEITNLKLKFYFTTC